MATGRVPTTANSPLTAKGDLFGYSTTQARVAVGNDGETLVADSSATTGLRYQGNFAAGKNKIINGDFRINQRAFSSTTTDGAFGFDRWFLATNGGTTYSTQTFTPGTAPVTGYNGVNFARLVTTGQTGVTAYSILVQKIEDIRTIADQSVTVSFWAKSASGTPKIAIEFFNYFGSGGSPSASTQTYAGQVTLSTSWARYTVTVTLPSLSGKTLGTDNNSSLNLQLWVSAGTDFNSRTGSLGIQSNTFDIWGVQLEAGSVATAFQTATGTLQGELAACQRYYYRTVADGAYTQFGNGHAKQTNSAQIMIPFPVPMRVAPSSLTYSSLVLFDGTTIAGISAVTVQYNGRGLGAVDVTPSGSFTQYRPYFMLSDNSTAGYIAFSAEL